MMKDHDENATLEDALESLKDEAREEGYQEGYLAALNDIELKLAHLPHYIPFSDKFWEATEQLRKMVTAK